VEIEKKPQNVELPALQASQVNDRV